jgi:hypothetical protein
MTLRTNWSFRELEGVCQIIFKVKPPGEFGARSYRQLTYFLADLRDKARMKEFFGSYSNTYRGEPSAKDEIFRFLRAFEYGLPQLFFVIEIFAARLNPRTDYSLFTAEMPRWFRPEPLKNLDEQGVPVKLSERFHRPGDTLEILIARLLEAANSGDSSLSQFGRDWILDALPNF